MRGTHAEERALHVELHVIVVEMHDANEAGKCRNLDVRRRRLGGFADNLHDVVALALSCAMSKSRVSLLRRQVKGKTGTADAPRG